MAETPFMPEDATLSFGGERRVDGFAVRLCWLCNTHMTVGVKLLHVTRVVAYLILTVEQLGDGPGVSEALDGVPWLDKPPLGWDVVPISRVGRSYDISRVEAQDEPPKRKRRVKAKGER